MSFGQLGLTRRYNVESRAFGYTKPVTVLTVVTLTSTRSGFGFYLTAPYTQRRKKKEKF